MNVGKTLRATAARLPDKKAIIYGDRSIPFKKLDQAADRILRLGTQILFCMQQRMKCCHESDGSSHHGTTRRFHEGVDIVQRIVHCQYFPLVFAAHPRCKIIT